MQKPLLSMMAVAGMALCLTMTMASANVTRDRSCIKPQQHGLASGPTPTGRTWKVSARIRPESACRSWFLQVNFIPSGTHAGSWAWGHRIEKGGHLADGFGIVGDDTVSEVGRVFSGIVGGRTKTVAVTLSNGKHITIHPKLPSPRQRDRYAWLHNLRYFVRFYSAGGRAKVVKLLDAQGKVLEVKGGRSF